MITQPCTTAFRMPPAIHAPFDEAFKFKKRFEHLTREIVYTSLIPDAIKP